MKKDNNKFEKLVQDIEVLKENEEGCLTGGVSAFNLAKMNPNDDTNYGCNANIYQCEVVEKKEENKNKQK